MDYFQHLLNHIDHIEKNIGYSFLNKDFLVLPFVHRSFVNENKKRAPEHNERLEFLGDSVLGLIISEFLFKRLEKSPEGELSSARSSLVDESSCMLYMKKLNIESFILLGKGERESKGMEKSSILADLFEALVASIYLDGGFSKAKEFVFSNFSDDIETILQSPHVNFKAQLQEIIQKKCQKTPEYRVLNEQGPDHVKTFFVEVYLDDDTMGSGEGPSKKQAEQMAAKEALKNKDNL